MSRLVLSCPVLQEGRSALEEQVASQKEKLKKAVAKLRSLREVRHVEVWTLGLVGVWACVGWDLRFELGGEVWMQEG